MVEGKTKSEIALVSYHIAKALITIRLAIAPRRSRREMLFRRFGLAVARLLSLPSAEAPGVAADPVAVQWRGLPARAAEVPRDCRILILKLDHLGDFVVALRAIERLRSAFADAHMTIVCGSWNKAWALQTGWFDKVVSYDFFAVTEIEDIEQQEREIERFGALGLGKFDLAIDLRHDPDTRILLAKVDARFRVGFSAPVDAGGVCMDLTLPDLEHISTASGSGLPVHAEQRLLLLATLTVDVFRPASPHPASRLVGQPADQVPVQDFAVLAPGAGSPLRCWHIDRFAATARSLAARGLRIVVVGSADDAAMGEAIRTALPEGVVQNLAGRLGLQDLPDVLRRSRVFVGNDTGSTHLAASLDVPTVVIVSGAPAVDVWQPVGRHVAVIKAPIGCSPCHLTRPEDCLHGVACMHVIGVDIVVDACEAVMDRRLAQTDLVPGQ
jgi:ADP-heptose:LPS heptosyltransferase